MTVSAKNLYTKKSIKEFALQAYDHVWVVENFIRNKTSALNDYKVREIIGKYLPKEDIVFSFDALGKPFFKNPKSKLFLSLSHSAHLLVLIISLDQNVGIDVELRKPRRFMEKIAHRYFKKEEINNLASFYRAWTSREAFFKATGAGLSSQLSQVKIKRVNKDLLVGLNDFSHKIAFFDPTSNYLGAVSRKITSKKELVFFKYRAPC